MFALFLVAACGGADAVAPPPTSAPRDTISQRATAYLDELIEIMEHNSIHRLTIDWETFRSAVFDVTPYAQSIEDTYRAIRKALKLLGDGHSSYRTESGTVFFEPTRRCDAADAGIPTLPSGIGYIKVGAFSGSAAEAADFADAIQRNIQVEDEQDLIGWIVDLRGNGGGNMWPMLAGLGPLLGEGVLGYFVEPTGAAIPWGYGDDGAWLDDRTVQHIAAPYELRVPEPKVAVLTDEAVASSGEAIVIAFRARPNTRSFGTATCGLSTANRPFRMSDDATLNLTVSFMADRTQTTYGDVVEPDQPSLDPQTTVDAAVEWLEGGP